MQVTSSAKSTAPLSVGQESLDAAVRALEEERRLAVAFVRSRWTPLETFMDDDGPRLMLELIQASPGERCVSCYSSSTLALASDASHVRAHPGWPRRAVRLMLKLIHASPGERCVACPPAYTRYQGPYPGILPESYSTHDFITAIANSAQLPLCRAPG